MTELERAHTALREIAMLCGNPDPSDGEGTTVAAVVSMVGVVTAERDAFRAELERLAGNVCEQDAESIRRVFGKS